MTMSIADRKSPMILLAIVAAASVIAWFVYVMLRDSVPGWAIAAGVAIIAFIAALTVNSLRKPADEALAQSLVQLPDVRTVGARVARVERMGTRENQDRRQTLLALILEVDGGQSSRIEVAVEDALLERFSTGSRLQLLQDPQHPHRVALDRRLSPTQVQ